MDVLDLVLAVIGILLLEELDALQCRRRELDVAVLDHDVAKDLGRVERLDPGRAARGLVRAVAAVCVLHGQEDVDAIKQPLLGDQGHDPAQALQVQHRLEPLGGAVGHDPAAVARREREPALGDVPIVLFVLGNVVLDL